MKNKNISNEEYEKLRDCLFKMKELPSNQNMHLFNEASNPWTL